MHQSPAAAATHHQKSSTVLNAYTSLRFSSQDSVEWRFFGLSYQSTHRCCSGCCPRSQRRERRCQHTCLQPLGQLHISSLTLTDISCTLAVIGATTGSSSCTVSTVVCCCSCASSAALMLSIVLSAAAGAAARRLWWSTALVFCLVGRWPLKWQRPAPANQQPSTSWAVGRVKTYKLQVICCGRSCEATSSMCAKTRYDVRSRVLVSFCRWVRASKGKLKRMEIQAVWRRPTDGTSLPARHLQRHLPGEAAPRNPHCHGVGFWSV